MKGKWKIAAALLLSLTFSVALASCGSGGDSTGSSDSPSSSVTESDVTSDSDSGSDSDSSSSQPAEETVTVTFETGEGSAVEAQTVTKGGKAKSPDEPVRSGYVFLGWYTSDDYEEEFFFTTALTEDTTIYARWGELVERDNLTYTPKKTGGYTVAAKEGASLTGEVTVLSEIDGEAVSEIQSEGFKGQTGITSLIVGDSVTFIGRYAFEGMSGLESLRIPLKLSDETWLFENGAPESLQKLTVTASGTVTGSFAGWWGIKELVLEGEISSLPAGFLSDYAPMTEHDGAEILLESVTLPFFGTAPNTEGETFAAVFGAGNYQMGMLSVPQTLKNVTIKSGTICPENAFYSLSSLENITLPEETGFIGRNAFNGCSALVSVGLGSAPTEIGTYAFYGCTSLSQLVIPDSVKTIGNYAFAQTAITTLNLPAGLEEFEFRNDIPGLEAFTISETNGYFSVKDGILFNKDGTTILSYPAARTAGSYTVGEGVTAIGDGAFMNAGKLAAVNLGQVTTIGSEAFRYTGLVSVTIPAGVTSIGKTAFSGINALTEFNFPSAEEQVVPMTIGDFLLSSCPNLKTLTVPSYITELPRYFVSGDTSLTELSIEGAVRSIGNRAFSSTGLTELSITFASGATIGPAIFYNSAALKTFYFYLESEDAALPVFATESGYDPGFSTFVPMIVVDSEALAESLKAADGWADYAGFISVGKDPSKLFVIENGVLVGWLGGAEDTRVIIPDGVTAIGYQCFERNATIEYVYIPSTVTTIYHYAFSSCSSLRIIEFGHTETLGISLKKNDGSELENRYFGQVFGSGYPLYLLQDAACKTALSALCGNSPLTVATMQLKADVDIREDVVLDKAGETLLRYIGKETSYTIPDTIKKLGAFAFAAHSKLTSVGFGKVEAIERYAFYGTALKAVALPETVTSIGDSAFSNLETLLSVSFSGATAIGRSAFSGCYNITSIDFGSKLVSIGYGAFSGAGQDGDGIASVVIPATVEDIGESAFEDSGISKIYCCFSQDRCADFDDEEAWLDTVPCDIVWDYVPA